MRAKQLQLELIKDQIETKTRDYKDVAKQLCLAIDPLVKNRCQRNLDNLQQEIEDLENLERTIQKELTQINSEAILTQLQNLLQAYPDNFNEILHTYIRVLEHRVWTMLSKPTCPDEVVNQLLRIPKSTFDYAALDEFVAYLVTNAQLPNTLIQSLQSWGEQRLSQEWTNLIGEVTQRQMVVAQQANPALLVLVNRRDEATTQLKTETYYQIKAWWIKDIDRYRSNKEGISAVGITGQTGDETVAHRQLSAELPKLICSFLTERSNENLPELHIFVPLELINEAIDCWKLDDGYGRPNALGRQYRIVLRCTERVSRSYRQEPLWKKRWRKHQALLEEIACNVFMPGNDSDLDRLYDDLDEAAETIVGLKVTQTPIHVGADSLFGVLLQLGIPLAVWGRCPLTNLTHEDELNRVLKACSLKNLPDTVKGERCAARRIAKDAHIGHHLSLLWDDPYLVPPKSA